MSLYHRHVARRLGLEQLEARAMLAVTAVQDGFGDVFITGDGDSDAIGLVFDSQGLTVIGNVDNAGPFANVRNLTIDMGAGDDTVTIVGDTLLADGDTVPFEIAGDLNVNMGAGGFEEFSVGGGGLDVAGNVVITSTGKTSADQNLYDFQGFAEETFGPGYEITIGGNLALFGGAGLEQLGLIFTNIGDDLLLFTGAGNDVFFASNARVADAVFASMGAGSDVFGWQVGFNDDAIDIGGSATILQAEQIDFVGAEDDFPANDERLEIVGGLNIIGTNQNDAVTLNFVEITGPTIIAAGGGNDSVTIEKSNLGLTILIGGAGTDDLDIVDSNIAFLIENFEV